MTERLNAHELHDKSWSRLRPKRRKAHEVPADEWANGEPPPPPDQRPLCAGCGARLKITTAVDLWDRPDMPDAVWRWDGYEMDENGVPLFHSLRCAASFAGAALRAGYVRSKHRGTKEDQ